MLLQPGHWLGRGSILVEGHSLGTTAQCAVQIERDESGLTLRAELTLQDAPPHEYVVRVVGNDVGTYTLHVQTGAELLHGTARALGRADDVRGQARQRAEPRLAVER